MLRAHERIKVNCSKWRSREDDDETNCFLVEQPSPRAVIREYGGMFLSSLDGDSRRFRENDDDWEKNNDSKREGDWILKDAPLQEWNGKNDEKWEESVRIREVGFLFPSFRRYLQIRIRLEMREKGRELESVQLSNNYGNLCIE